MKMIYLAGGLFNAAERLHNLFLEKHLVILGYTVILPQREALRFFKDGVFNTKALAHNCQNYCANSNVIYVGCIDGADADSGTSIEYGIAAIVHGNTIVYRTDFRTALEKELGINAMFSLGRTVQVYNPCYFTHLTQVDDYYHTLAQEIHAAIEWL